MADYSHEISRLVFFEKIKKNKNKMSSATNFAWHFKGLISRAFVLIRTSYMYAHGICSRIVLCLLKPLTVCQI